MLFPCRPTATAMLLFGAALLGPSAAEADELRPRLAAADMGAAGAFAARGKLNDAELRSVSGLGAAADPKAATPNPGDVSVILFDELGRRKRDGLSPGSGASSSVAHGVNVGVNVQVGR